MDTTYTPPTVDEAVMAVSTWLGPSRERFRSGDTVLVTMSPGEGTKYTMLFVSSPVSADPTPQALATVYKGSPESHNLGSTDKVLVLLDDVGSKAMILPPGLATGDFVGSKLDLVNRYTEAAVGIVASLMRGSEPATVARAYASYSDIIGRWRLDRFPRA